MIGKAKFSFLKAHEILWKLGYWRYLLVPIILSVVLAVVLVVLCFAFSSILSVWLHEFLSTFFELPEWFRLVLMLFIIVFEMGPFYVAFRSLVMVCYAPFLDKLSVKVEELVNGHSKEFDRGFIESIKRPLMMASFTISASVAVFVGGLFIGLVPVAGILISSLMLIPFQIFLSSVAYVDPYLERSGYTPRESIVLMRKNIGSMLIFGLFGFIIMMIPIIGWFVGPTYSVVAGIVFGILISKESVEFNKA